MSQITISNLTFSYEGSFENVFEDVNLILDSSWKLGLIGRNGKGKTTLLKLLSGELSGYCGNINIKLRTMYFPYDIPTNKQNEPFISIYEDIDSNIEEWKIFAELNKLDIDIEVLYRPYNTLSHGERTKVLLATLFAIDEAFLLIDEPTNHLDQETRQVVKQYLASKKGFILISHDRDLLDGVVDHILVFNRKTIEVQSGNFTSWYDNKKRNDAFAIAENKKHLGEISKLRKASEQTNRWAIKNENSKIGFDPIKEHERNISTRAYIGSKTKKLQSQRMNIEKRINREIERKENLLQDIEKIEKLKLTKLRPTKKVLMYFDDFSLKYNDAENPLFTKFKLEVKEGDRIAIDGRNGTGKSSLINFILGNLGVSEVSSSYSRLISEGKCEITKDLIISYISQDTSHLKGDITNFCYEYGIDKSLFCSLLIKLDFEKDDFLKDIKDYSAGQKKKILIAKSLLTPAHIYIWDEPLNYLDIFSRVQVEDVVKDFDPTILFIEHDVKFKTTIANKIVTL